MCWQIIRRNHNEIHLKEPYSKQNVLPHCLGYDPGSVRPDYEALAVHMCFSSTAQTRCALLSGNSSKYPDSYYIWVCQQHMQLLQPSVKLLSSSMGNPLFYKCVHAVTIVCPALHLWEQLENIKTLPTVGLISLILWLIYATLLMQIDLSRCKHLVTADTGCGSNATFNTLWLHFLIEMKSQCE